MDFLEMLNVIQTQYPEAMAILQKPGVAQVYVDYLNAQPPWTNAQLQAALRQTPYYQNSPQAVRDWDILQATDPATAKQRADQVNRWIGDLEAQTGIKLDESGGFGSQKFSFLVDAVKNNWDQNEIKYRLLASSGQYGGGGDLGASAARVRSLANDYAVPLSDAAIMDWARKLDQGAIDQNAVQGYLIEQAKSLFPALNDALDRGITVKQYASPYLQIAAQELNIDPNTVNLTDGKWLSALNQVDQKTGQRVSMSLDQWLSKVRTDPAYGYDQTNKARQDATTLTAQLAQRFGAM